MRTIACRVPSHGVVHHLVGMPAASACLRIAAANDRAAAISDLVASAPGPLPSTTPLDPRAVTASALSRALDEVDGASEDSLPGGADDGSASARALVERVRDLGGTAEVLDVGEDGLTHRVALVGESTVVDLRARRFDPDAPHPLVVDAEEYRLADLRGRLPDLPSLPLELSWVRLRPGVFGDDPTDEDPLRPEGWFVEEAESFRRYPAHSYERGRSRFERPLHLRTGTADHSSAWTRRLSRYYGGASGRDLSRALVRDGYDAVISVDDDGARSIVDLTPA